MFSHLPPFASFGSFVVKNKNTTGDNKSCGIILPLRTQRTQSNGCVPVAACSPRGKKSQARHSRSNIYFPNRSRRNDSDSVERKNPVVGTRASANGLLEPKTINTNSMVT
jgi:hypothetical protein